MEWNICAQRFERGTFLRSVWRQAMWHLRVRTQYWGMLARQDPVMLMPANRTLDCYTFYRPLTCNQQLWVFRIFWYLQCLQFLCLWQWRFSLSQERQDDSSQKKLIHSIKTFYLDKPDLNRNKNFWEWYHLEDECCLYSSTQRRQILRRKSWLVWPWLAGAGADLWTMLASRSLCRSLYSVSTCS